MANFQIQTGTNTGTTGDDFFELVAPVGDFTLDALDGLDEAHVNVSALTGSASFQNLEALLLYGALDQPFVFSSGIPIVDISRVESLVLMTAAVPAMTILGGPTSYVGVASDLPLAYNFETGEAALAIDEQNAFPFSFQEIKGIIGGAGNDVFIGDERGNDFMPGLGQNTVVGGEGLDRVIVFIEEYDPEQTQVLRDGETVIVDGPGENGIQAAQVERFVFSNGELDLLGYVAVDTGVAQNAGTAYRTYQAAFNRTPDTDGLGFWIEKLDTGLSFKEMCSYFLTSDEFQELYGENPSSNDYVAALYGNVLQREPDQAGIDFWRGKLDAGDLDRADLLLYFADSDENVALVQPAIEDGIFII